MKGRKFIKGRVTGDRDNRVAYDYHVRLQKRPKCKKGEGKNCMWAQFFFILLILDEKLFSTRLYIKLPYYSHFKILIIKYIDKIVIV